MATTSGTSSSIQPPGWITRKEVAAKLGITFAGVRHLEKQGHLASLQAQDEHKRDVYFYDPAEVEAFLAARKKRVENPIESAADDEAAGPPNALKEIGVSHVVAAVTAGMKQAQGHAQVLIERMTAMMGTLSEASSKVLGALSTENEKLRERCSKLETAQWSMMEMFQANLNEQHDRQQAEADAAHTRKMKEEAFEKLMAYVPLAAAFVGSKLAPGNPLPKEMALQSIVERMSPEDLERLMKSGAVDQAGMATILAIRERLNDERLERLRKQAEAAGVDTKGTGPATEEPAGNGASAAP